MTYNSPELDMLRQMLRIREFQLRIENEYHLDEMKTPVHLYIGQEAIAVGALHGLRAEDYVSSNHRGHGHYLAKGGDMKALAAELFGRETGCSRGRGGSMHLVDVSVGHMGSSSIVGGGIPIGVGQALAIRLRKQDHVSVIFFGDGAADEGTFYESLNFSMLKKLPAVFILENNQWSVCSSVASRWPGENCFHSISDELLFSAKVDGNDLRAVRQAALTAVERARSGQGPSFIEAVTYRLRGHAGAGSDAHLGYRTQEEIDHWAARCPIARYRAYLIQAGLLNTENETMMMAEIKSEIDEAFQFAKASPWPLPDELERHVVYG